MTGETIRRVLVCVLAMLLVVSIAAAQSSDTSNTTGKKGQMSSDKNAVNSACSAEAQTAGCGSETVGHGLLKCIHAYKQAHSDFKISEGCRSAMKQLRADSGHKVHGNAGANKTTTPPQ